jgi:hypothetical protein
VFLRGKRGQIVVKTWLKMSRIGRRKNGTCF